ncbi:putative reverse transcriptase domain-containing protein [Tanacetum coccineum]
MPSTTGVVLQSSCSRNASISSLENHSSEVSEDGERDENRSIRSEVEVGLRAHSSELLQVLLDIFFSMQYEALKVWWTRGRSGDQGDGRIDGQGGQVGGQGSEVNDGVNGVPGFSTIITQQLQNLLSTIVAQVGDQGRGQGNGRNQNGDVVNDNIRGDVSRGCTYKEFLACNPKEYDGKGGAIVYTRWIEKMESEDFKTLTREEFCPSNEMQKLETELWNHAMVGVGHAAYTDRFHELARLVPHLVTPEGKRIESLVGPVVTLSDAYQRALAFEKQSRRVRSSTSLAITGGGSSSSNVASYFVPNHVIPEEWENDGVSNDDYKEPLVFDDDQYEEEVMIRDVGLNLMVRRYCLTPQAVGDDWLKHNFFQSTCTILGKVCIFMVDPGSCDNLIAEVAVRKLGLKTENRLNYYKLQWLKKGTEVIVSKRVLVTFSMGTTYKDSVWCDMVPMDTYHLLLGRPWEYDRNTTHNGRTNTYSFLFGGVKITLMPNKPKELVNKHTGTLLTLSQFEDELEMGDEVHRVVHDNLDRGNSKYKQDADQHLLPYHGDSSDDDLVVNSRANFVYLRGNDAGPSPGSADSKLGMRRTPWKPTNLDSICYLDYFTTSVGIRAEVLVKMPPKRNRPLTEAYEQEFKQRVMARMEERLDQFVDQLADRMNDMMNPRRRRDHNSRGSEGEEEDNRRWESRMRVNIPEFNGDTLYPEGFIDCLVAVEEVFEFKEVPENKRVSLITTKLRGGGSSSSNVVSHFVPNQAKPGGGSGLKCFNCGETHDGMANDDYKEVPVFYDDLYEEEVMTGDVGVNLMVRRFCLTPQAVGDDCYDNLIAEEAVQKLGLKTKNRPKHYKLQWLKKGTRFEDELEMGDEVHRAVHDNLVRGNSKYKQDADQVDFEVGDFMWAVLTKDHFLVGEYNKLSTKKIGSLEIIEKIDSDAYCLKLPSHIRCSDVFNVKHLLPYHNDSSDDDLVVKSRANFVYPRGNDAGPSVEEHAILFIEAQDRVKKSLFQSGITWAQRLRFRPRTSRFEARNEENAYSCESTDSICYLEYFTTSVGIRAEVPVKMPPRRNRPLTEAYEQEFEQRVMARMEERLD